MFTHPVGDSRLLLAVTEFYLYCSKLILRIIPRISAQSLFYQVSLINRCWVRLRGDAHKKNATRILASSTKTRNSFATIFADELHPLCL